MEPFETLGRELRRRWARCDFDEDRFPELAASALERARPHETCRQAEILSWVARTAALPRQGDPHFGQPPVNLYRDDQLFIEALFWVDGTTSIHQHAFSGAFCVLEGSSVHVRYDFSPRRRLNDQLQLGALETAEVELLTPGDVRPIAAGPAFIHALFHLERPTLSLVVRTHRAPRHATQYAYFPPGLALDPFWKPESLTRRLAVLDMLLETDHPELSEFTASLLDGADVMTWALALQRMNLHENGYDRVESLLGRAPGGDAELVDALREALRQERWSAFVVARRSKLTRPDLRFFLGLVLNVVGRARLLALVEARFPERDPADTVLDWLREMRDTPCEGGNALGVELDDAGLWVVRQLVHGKTEAWIASEAARTGQPLTAAEIGKLCFVLPFNSVLGRLVGP